MSLADLSEEQLIDLKWRRGALKFLLRDHQHPIYNALWACIADEDPEHSSHVISSSRQLGKSFTEIVVAVEYCLRYPKSTVLFVAPLKSQAEEIIYGETYFRVFETCPQDLKPKLDGATVIFPNGSRIRLGGTDGRRYEDLRGGAAHLLILDEAGFMAHLDDGVLPALQPMLNTTRGKTIFSSTPPPTLEHPYVNIHRDHAEKGHVSAYTIYDNTFLTEADIVKALVETGSKKIDGKWVPSTRFRREYLAEFIMEGTQLIVPDWSDDFIQEREPNEYFEFHHRYVSMDPGVTDLNVCLFAHYDHENEHLHIEDELVNGGKLLNSEILSTGIKEKMSLRFGTKKPYRMPSDNNNPHLLQDLKTIYGLPFTPTTKTRLESTRAAYEEGMVTKLNNWLRRGRISVHPRCEHLIGALKYGVWTEKSQNKREFGHSKTYGHYDAVAALVYMVRNIDERTNPVPINHGHTFNTQINPNYDFKPPNKDLRTLSGALSPNRR